MPTQIVCSLLTLYLVMIFARVVLSWFPLNPSGVLATVAGFLYVATDVVLGPLRRNIPVLRVGSVALDPSPLIVIFGIYIVIGLVC